MKLSIIIPTLGRTTQVEALLESLSYIETNDFEVIIVNQNNPDTLRSIIKKFECKYTIYNYNVSFNGLSKAKNYGIEHSSGEYIIFMDDDAEILPYSIDNSIKILDTKQEIDVVCGKMVDREHKDSVRKFRLHEKYLTLKDFEGCFIESAMMFRRNSLIEYRYDEKLGCGVFHGSEEGFDLVYRMLLDAKILYYSPQITYYHPKTINTHNTEAEIKRVFTYKCGFAYVCNKHKMKRRYYSRLIKVILYIPYLCIFKPSYVRYYIAELLGLLSGRIIK